MSRSSLVRGTTIVSVLTLLSRLLGFIRDLLVARLLGTSWYADAFFVAFRIPNLLRSLFAEGALTSAFVPTFTDQLRLGAHQAQKAFSSVLATLLLATGFITLLGIITAPQIVDIFSPGFGVNPEAFALTTALTRIMFPYIIFVSVVVLINGALNAHLVFGASAWAQVVMNIVLIIGAVAAFYFAAPSSACIFLGISVLAGGMIQVLVQLPALYTVGIKLFSFWGTNIWSPAVRATLRLMIPAAAGAGVYQLTILINTILASLVGEGAVSALYYADRITQLPIGVFSISLASVLLPILSRAEAQGDRNMASSQLGAALSATSFMMIPFTAFLLSESNIIVRALFERGAFSPDATMATASAVKALSVSLWSVSCSSLLARAFTARKMLNIPLQSAVISLGISMLTAVITMGAPKSELKGLFADSLSFIQTYLPISWSLGHVGLATASTVGSLASTIFLIIRYITLDTSNIGKLMLISLIRALISTGVAFLLASFLFSDFFFLKIILGTFIYILLNFALKSPEIKGIIQILNQKNSEDLS